MDVRILGPLEVRDGATAIAVRAGTDRALLALLLLNGNDVVASARMIDVLSGAAAPVSAPKIVQSAISRLRRALGGGRIETHGAGYRLVLEPAELDATRFRRLVAEGRAARRQDPALLPLRSHSGYSQE